MRYTSLVWGIVLVTTVVADASSVVTRDNPHGRELDQGAGAPVNNAISEEEIMFDYLKSAAERAKGKSCEEAGGKCMLKKTVKKKCKGKVHKKPKCAKKNDVCCISARPVTTEAPAPPTARPVTTEAPAPPTGCPKGYYMHQDYKQCFMGCPEGFFMFSNQCFMIIKDTYRTWTDAKEKCEELGERIVMAKPYDPLNLQIYLVIRYGYDSDVWLGARGDGTYMTWERDGQQISSRNPYWYPGFEKQGGSSSRCLMLLADEGNWKKSPDHPYAAWTCSSVSAYALCEFLME